MSSDAENRAAAILLPGQELELPANELLVSSTPNLSEVAKTPALDWDYLASPPFIQQQFFDLLPPGPISYFISTSALPGTLSIRLHIGSDVVVPARESQSPTRDSFSYENFQAEMNYATGLLTLYNTGAPVDYMYCTYNMKREVSYL